MIGPGLSLGGVSGGIAFEAVAEIGDGLIITFVSVINPGPPA